MSYQEFLDCDLRAYKALVDGFTRRREYNINDSLQVGHAIAEKIAQAVWGDRKFSRPIKPVNLLKKDVKTTIQAHLDSMDALFATLQGGGNHGNRNKQ